MLNFQIRELVFQDISFLWRVREECSEFLHNQKKFTIDECKQWFNEANPKFFIFERSNGKITDRIGYFRTSEWGEKSICIGMDIHAVHRGKGYAKIAYKMFFMLLKETYKIEHVYLEVIDTNTRARQLYNDLGFETFDMYTLADGRKSLKMYLHI